MSRAWALLALTLWARPARAADCGDIDPQPFAGTIAYRAGVLSRTSFGAAFGVANFLEQRVFPELDRGHSAMSFQGAVVANAARVPTIRPGCAVLGDSYELLPVNQYAMNIGFGAKLPYGFEVFYAGNVTESLVASDDFGESFVGHTTLLKGLGTGLIAPIMMLATDQDVDGPQASYYDFMAGVGWGLGFGSIRAGYVGSSGLFLNLGSYEVGVSAAAVLDFDAALISYLKGGLGPYSTPIGLTSVFARASILSSGPRVDPVTGKEVPGAPLAQDEWVTIHLHQELAGTKGWGIGPDNLTEPVWLELEGALTVRPDVDFFTARATYHSDLVYVSVGVTRPPDLFAVGGGHDFRLSAGAGLNIFVSALGGEAVHTERLPLVSMRVSLNDGDLVRLFPTAPGQVVGFHLEFHLAGWDAVAPAVPAAPDAPAVSAAGGGS